MMKNDKCSDFCSKCGQQAITIYVPVNDNRPRKVCHHCHFIHYENPKVVVGAVTTFEKKFLLCKRAIMPQLGLWTYPAGFLENDETLEEGAKREAFEEAFAEIDISHLVGVYSLTRINQVHIIYAATMQKPEYKESVESSEVLLLDRSDIPWDTLAFPVIKWALKAFITNEPGVVERKSSGGSLDEAWKI